MCNVVEKCISQHQNTTLPTTHESATTSRISSEVVAHAVLRLVADMPGKLGRLRAARVVGKFSVSTRSEEEAENLSLYGLPADWRLQDLIALVDALIDGGLMVTTAGARPYLALTRAGHHALNTLEGINQV